MKYYHLFDFKSFISLNTQQVKQMVMQYIHFV